MAVIEFQTREFGSNKILPNVEVTAKWNFLGIPIEQKIFTGEQGNGQVDVGATSANVEFTGKLGFYRFTQPYIVEVGLFGIGVTPSNPQIFYMKSDVIAPITDPIHGAIDYAKSIGNTATIVFALAFGVTAAYLIYKYVNTGQFVGTAKKASAGAKSAFRSAVK